MAANASPAGASVDEPKVEVAASASPRSRALVCQPAALEFESVASTSMFSTLGGVRALPAAEASRAIVCRSIAESRGYRDEDLHALAEIGYHYLRSGGLKLSAVIFEGLTAIQPEGAFYWLALGLTRDHLGDKLEAKRAYERAAQLQPTDPRPELNLAELALEAGDRARAGALLRRAEAKAEAAGDQPLVRKARALLALAGR